jgi:hypothetical protein
MSTTKPGVSPKVTMYVPYLAHYVAPGSSIGLTYTVTDGSKLVATAQPVATLAFDQSITFTPVFKPVKGHTYSVTVVANEQNGHTEQRTAIVRVS